MSEEPKDGVWNVLIRSDEVGHKRFMRSWDSFSDDELLDILEHLYIVESAGADPDNACAIATESERICTAYVERTSSSNFIIFLAEETAERTFTVLEVSKDKGIGTYALGERATREMLVSLKLLNPTIEYLQGYMK